MGDLAPVGSGETSEPVEPAEEPYRGVGCLYSRDPEHTMGLVLSVPGAELWL